MGILGKMYTVTMFLFCFFFHSSGEFSFAVFGDMQADDCNDNGYIIRQTSAMALSGAAFYVSTGDLIAGYNQSSCFTSNGNCTVTGNTGSVKNNLAPLMKNPLPGLLSSLYLVIGNHDDNWGSGWYPDKCGGGICDVIFPLFVNHPDTFKVPGFYPHILKHGDICSLTKSTSGHSQDYYYSFTYKDCYFIMLRITQESYGMFACNNKPSQYATTVDYATDPALYLDPSRNKNCYNVYQYDWMLSELAKAAKYRHIFVFAHAPLLTSSENHPATQGADKLRSIFEQYGVRAYFNGHNHSYERTWPLKGLSKNPSGVVYITVGPAGAKADAITGAAFTAASYKNWTTYTNQEKMSGYMLMKVKDDGTVEGRRMGITNNVQDTFTLGRSTVTGLFGARKREDKRLDYTIDRNKNLILRTATPGDAVIYLTFCDLNGKVVWNSKLRLTGGVACMPLKGKSGKGILKSMIEYDDHRVETASGYVNINDVK